MMAQKKIKGAASRFIPGSGIARHREWRGLGDTAFDYLQWLQNVGIMGAMVAKSPLRIMRGMLEYRWLGAYLGAFQMIDKGMEGIRGPALRAMHAYMHAIMKGSTTQIANMMKGDRRFGENSFSRKMVLLEQTMPPELLAGFPNLVPMQLEAFQGLLACYMDQNICPHYIDAVEHYGLPADSCRLSANAVGVAIEDDFPQIGACIIANNAPCDSSVMNSQLIDRRLGIPSTTSDVPMRWEDRETDKYALAQMKKNIAFIEKCTGERFDPDAFMEGVRRHNLEVANEFEKWDIMRTPYSALGCVVPALFHAFYFTFSGGSMPYVLKAERKVRPILERAVAEKTNCFPKARHRAVIWGGPPCFWLQIPNWLYNCWGILTVAAMDSFEGNVVIPTASLDEALIGTARNIEHGVMRRHLTGGWEHLVEFWEEGEKFGCDIAILYLDITCKGALGLTGYIMDQAKDKSMKLMLVSHDLFDHRTITRQDMRDEINKYMSTVMREEPLDPSLLVFDDDKGW